MAKVFMSKRKTVSAVIAVVMCAVIIFGGTFAWQSIQQEALNEVSATVNPGGRLHDDFNDITEATGAHTMTFDKDVYVENFTTYAANGVQIFARIRLDEYMELGKDAGVAGNTTAKSVVVGATLDDKTSWTPHIPNNTEDPFHEYWNWDISSGEDEGEGKVTYLPTYNKNKDSLAADINGTFDADFTDYVDYYAEANKTQNYYEIEDADGNDNDELAQWNVDINNVIKTGELGDNYDQHVSITKKEHTVKESLSAYVITMEDWLKLPADQQVGDFWVWDADGWAYWANAINPETATGALLQGISRTETVINEDWYYAINVVGQFITKDNLGKEEGNGFYAPNAGKAPSYNALTLLNAIGVDVDTTVPEDDVKALANALELGGNIKLNGTYNATETVEPEGFNNPVSYAWTTGGTLTGGTLSSDAKDEAGYAVLLINAEKGWPNDNDGAVDAIVNDVTVTADERSAINVQAINADVTLNRVIATNTYGAGVYAHYGTGKTTLNSCTITAPTEDTGNERGWALAAVGAGGEANIVINGGTYTGKYAAYVYPTGGSITILDGNFTGDLKAEAGSLVIKGGTFSVDSSAFVDLNTYQVEENTAEGTWTVK